MAESLYYRTKKSFTSGILSPLMRLRVDNARFESGCFEHINGYSKPQGAAVKCPGFAFKLDVREALGLPAINPAGNPDDYAVRFIPFIFNRDQSYAILFVKSGTGAKLLFFTEDGVLLDGGNPYILTITENLDVNTFDYAQSGDTLYIARGDSGSPMKIVRNSATDWEASVLVFNDVPSDWSPALGHPKAVTFHEQRLFWANTTTRPNTIWASVSGDFTNHEVNSPVEDIDALTFTLDSGEQNGIQWLVSRRTLTVGTLGSEFTVSGNGRPLTFNNLNAQRHTNEGSFPLSPLVINSSIIFLQRHQKTVNQLSFDFSEDSYVTTDLSILAPHLTACEGISDWTYQSHPNGRIWGLRDDGDLLGLTYQREHDIAGWDIRNTQGEFKALTSIPSESQDEIWVCIERAPSGNPKHYVEKLAKEYTPGCSAGTNYPYLDSYLETSTSKSAGDVVSGLDHLEGETVKIQWGGMMLPDQTVSGGGITLPDTLSASIGSGSYKVLIGLSYEWKLVPTLPKIPTNSGSHLGRKLRPHELVLHVLDTLGIRVQKQQRANPNDPEIEIFNFFPDTNTYQPQPLKSGEIPIPYPQGYSLDSRFAIVSDLPYPVTILGITEKVKVNG